jgi:hypothetical protein
MGDQGWHAFPSSCLDVAVLANGKHIPQEHIVCHQGKKTRKKDCDKSMDLDASAGATETNYPESKVILGRLNP